MSINRLVQRLFVYVAAFAISIAALFGRPSSGAIIFVDWRATSGSQSGESWANAYLSLQTALSAASADDEIRVAAGTYKPTTGTDQTVSFVLNKPGLNLRGGYEGAYFSGGQNQDRRAPGSSSYLTILSGDIDGDAKVDEENSHHVVKVVGPFPNAPGNADQFVTINGFVITAGYADGPNSTFDNRGGGLLVRHVVQTGGDGDAGSTRVNVIYCDFRDNVAAAGGAMHSELGGEDGKAVQVISSTFQNNRALDMGIPSPVAGALCMTGQSAGPGMGFTAKGFVEITNSLFVKNQADLNGGGLFNGSANVTIVNCTVADNQAGIVSQGDGQGGPLREHRRADTNGRELDRLGQPCGWE
jgi:hypothetical protein